MDKQIPETPVPQTEPTIEEKIDATLEKLRPFLRQEGGDIRLDRFDAETGICYVDMIGACSGCVMASSDVSDSVEIMLMDEIPAIKKVELIAPAETNSMDSLIQQIQAQEAANHQLEEMLKKKEAEGSNDGNPSKPE